IGPLTNLAELAVRFPELKDKCRIVWLGGSIYQGYLNQTAATNDFNTAQDPAALDVLLQSGFKLVLAPLDVCRDFVIEGDNFAALKASLNPYAQNALAFYREWHGRYHGGAIKYDPDTASGILYDLVPFVYLTDETLFLKKSLSIVCDKNGYTRIDPAGFPVDSLMRIDKDAALSVVTRVFTA
ncbi:MAG: nucleoside hydrolase, partial [Clostridiales bacterium]|nr:nucleoside hydrolase [Clostridiales bacterium]